MENKKGERDWHKYSSVVVAVVIAAAIVVVCW
jgi:hypothetical protein